MRNVNKTVWELLAGILFSGAVLLLIGILAAGDKVYFAAGLGIGVLVAIFMTIHIYVSIEKSIDVGEGGARNSVIISYVIRTLVLLASILITGIFKLGSLVGLLLGILTLKVAAYIQPVTHKFIEGIKSGSR